MSFNGSVGMNYKLRTNSGYEITEVPDHLFTPALKISRRLEKITGLQITSADQKGRESEIPFADGREHELDDIWMVSSVIILVKRISLHTT